MTLFYLCFFVFDHQTVSVSATAVSQSSVSATAVTEYSVSAHFRLRPKPTRKSGFGLPLILTGAKTDFSIGLCSV